MLQSAVVGDIKRFELVSPSVFNVHVGADRPRQMQEAQGNRPRGHKTGCLFANATLTLICRFSHLQCLLASPVGLGS